MRLLAEVKFLVVHCADTKTEMDVSVSTLRRWHIGERGWSDIGYHHFIKFDGSIHECRDEKYQGAHCKSVNDKSIAICLEGGYGGVDNFTTKQKQSLMFLIGVKKSQHKNAAVVGHNHFDNKACPSFDVVEWYESNLNPIKGDCFG